MLRDRLRCDRARPESERRYQLGQRTVQAAPRRSAAANPYRPLHEHTPYQGDDGRDPTSLSPRRRQAYPLIPAARGVDTRHVTGHWSGCWSAPKLSTPPF